MPNNCTCNLFLGYLEERCRLAKMYGWSSRGCPCRRLQLKVKLVRMKASVQNSIPFSFSSPKYVFIVSPSFAFFYLAARLWPYSKNASLYFSTHLSNSPFVGFMSSEKISRKVSSLYFLNVSELTYLFSFSMMRLETEGSKWPSIVSAR
jgi:hypothetical protein